MRNLLAGYMSNNFRTVKNVLVVVIPIEVNNQNQRLARLVVIGVKSKITCRKHLPTKNKMVAAMETHLLLKKRTLIS